MIETEYTPLLPSGDIGGPMMWTLYVRLVDRNMASRGLKVRLDILERALVAIIGHRPILLATSLPPAEEDEDWWLE